MRTLRTLLATMLLAISTMTMNAQPMSYYAIRDNARFLTDRMAYTLGIASYLIDDLYCINYDYIYGVNDYLDDIAYGYHYDDYMAIVYARDMALRRLLTPYQWNRLMELEYFYRPISFAGHRWCFTIYAHDPYRDRFYYNAPRLYIDYRGGRFFGGMHIAGGPVRPGGFLGPARMGGPATPPPPGGPGYHIGNPNPQGGPAPQGTNRGSAPGGLGATPPNGNNYRGGQAGGNDHRGSNPGGIPGGNADNRGGNDYRGGGVIPVNNRGNDSGNRGGSATPSGNRGGSATPGGSRGGNAGNAGSGRSSAGNPGGASRGSAGGASRGSSSGGASRGAGRR